MDELEIALRKFKAANKKLTDTVGSGKYHSINLEVTSYPLEGAKVECRLYTTDCSWHYGNTWEKAFESLKAEMMKKEKERKS